MKTIFTDTNGQTVAESAVLGDAPAAPPTTPAVETSTPVPAPVAAPVSDTTSVVASKLPKGFTGRIVRPVIVGDTSIKGNNKGVTFRPGDEEKLALHLVRLREAQPHDYSELVRMKVIIGDWKLQFIRL